MHFGYCVCLFVVCFFQTGFHYVAPVTPSGDKAGLELTELPLLLPPAGIKGLCHHRPAESSFLEQL